MLISKSWSRQVKSSIGNASASFSRPVVYQVSKGGSVASRFFRWGFVCEVRLKLHIQQKGVFYYQLSWHIIIELSFLQDVISDKQEPDFTFKMIDH